VIYQWIDYTETSLHFGFWLASLASSPVDAALRWSSLDLDFLRWTAYLGC